MKYLKMVFNNIIDSYVTQRDSDDDHSVTPSSPPPPPPPPPPPFKPIEFRLLFAQQEKEDFINQLIAEPIPVEEECGASVADSGPVFIDVDTELNLAADEDGANPGKPSLNLNLSI